MDKTNGHVTRRTHVTGLRREVAQGKREAAAVGTRQSGAVFNEGDVLVPKIANVRLMAQPSDTAKPVATLARTDELVVVGGVKDGFVNVQTATATGWVKAALVSKR